MCLTLPESDWLPTISDYRPEGRGVEKEGEEVDDEREGWEQGASEQERKKDLVSNDR